MVLVIVAERRLTLARPFKAGNSRRVCSRRVATPEMRGFFNRRYATGPIHDLIPALKGRAKVSRRSATKSTIQLPHYRILTSETKPFFVGIQGPAVYNSLTFASPCKSSTRSNLIHRFQPQFYLGTFFISQITFDLRHRFVGRSA